jgi:hypothetical protein
MTAERTRPLSFARRAMLAAACLASCMPATHAATVPPEIGVRSMVANPAGPFDRGRIYAILSVQMASSDPRNALPVDEDALISHVCRALDTQGFSPAVKGQTPEILITVHYGRAWLRNPYLNDTGDSQAIEGSSSLPELRGTTHDVAGVPTRFMDEIGRRREAQIQKAGAEKLYIRVTGWRYPADPKAKAVMLWKTTALVDDPDHWNLNAVAGDMLEAGAPYLGRAIPEKEISVRPAVPVGHVNVGTAEVVDAVGAKPSPAAAPSAPARAPTSRGKLFNLPAGDAAATLQAFSRQSGEEIIYPIEQIRGIRTNEVHGEMSPRAALDRLLDGTGLSAVQDEKSEALAVRPSPRR